MTTMQMSGGRDSGVHLVIYGTHSPDWMRALAPDNPLWRDLPGLARISQIEADPQAVRQVTEGDASRVVLLPLLEDHADRLPAGVARFHPPRQVSDLLRDKRRTLEYAAAHGLAAWCPEVFHDLSAVRFPCVVKRVNLNGSVGVNMAHSRHGLDAFLSEEPGADHVVQAFTYGAKEYATYLALKEGEILWDATFRYEMEFADIIRRPFSARAARVATPAGLLDQFARFLAPLNYSGICNFDFKIGHDGRAVIFEVNPRLGGSLMRPENEDLLREVVRLTVEHARVPAPG